MNIPFQKSSQFYEVIYQSKDYQKETDYLYSLLKELNVSIKGNLLDIGCGTGGYIPWHLKRNVKVTGLDISEEMLAIAKNKYLEIELIQGDLGLISISKKFDLAFMMFHVINYQTTNEKLTLAFQNIGSHLQKGGILLFDFWHGSAIEIDPPKKIERVFAKDKLKIVRKTTPSIENNNHLVDVCFDFAIFENDKPITSFQEHHLLRYLYTNELYTLLENAGFEICICNGWLKNIAITNQDWYGMMVARKIK